MKKWYITIYYYALVLLTVAWAVPVTGEDEIKPSNVYYQVRNLQAELELVRNFIGRPPNTQTEINVINVFPREVYFQAQTMLRKVSQFHYDLFKEPIVSLPKIPGLIVPKDVYVLVTASLDKARDIKHKLGINKEAVLAVLDETKTPTDVFKAIVQTSRQMNLMLDRRYSSTDVFPQMRLAIRYSQLLSGNDTVDSIPIECCKTPQNVYRQLAKCFGLVGKLMNKNGIKGLEFTVKEEDISMVNLSDVNDLASMIVSELAHLNLLSGNKQTLTMQYAGRRFPYDVYRQAVVLETQLHELLQQEQG